MQTTSCALNKIPGHRMQETRSYRIQNTEYRTQDTGYRICDTIYMLRGTGPYRIQHIQHRVTLEIIFGTQRCWLWLDVFLGGIVYATSLSKRK